MSGKGGARVHAEDNEWGEQEKNIETIFNEIFFIRDFHIFVRFVRISCSFFPFQYLISDRLSPYKTIISFV